MDTLVRSDEIHEIRHRIKAIGYAAKHCFSHLKPFEFERMSVRAN